MKSPIKIVYSMVTNVGSRSVNEDSIGEYNGDNLSGFVLCDGLGGHGMGDKASSLVRDVFLNRFHNAKSAKNVLKEAFMAAQDILMAEQKKQKAEKKMKTTAVALALDYKKAYIGHVGDSRLYVFRDNKVEKRTLDHSIPQMLVLSGDIKEEEIRHHPDRSMLMRVMGNEWEKPAFELMKPLPIKKCQAFLLCSDGFWELIEEKRMCELLERADSCDAWLGAMHAEVLKNGAGTNMDNNSAIAIWCV